MRNMQRFVEALWSGGSPTVVFVRALVRDDHGQDLMEYAFIAAFFGIAGWLALSTIGPTVGATYASWVSPTTGAPSLWEPAQPWTSSGS
jgi:Flp pilus assembly pilin Flp